MIKPCQYAPQGPAGAPGPVAARNGMGVTALVLGIIGVVSGIPMILFWLAGPLGLLALIFGIVGHGRAKKGQATNKGVALTGTILGILSLLLAITGLILTLWVFDKAEDAVDDVKESIEQAKGNDVTGVLKAGDPAKYNNGVELSIAKPQAYTIDPNTLISGHTDGNTAYMVTVTIKNTGSDAFDGSFLLPEARVDGKEIVEVNDETHGLGHRADTVAPGATAKVDMVFDAPPTAKEMEIKITPDLLLDDATWKLSL